MLRYTSSSSLALGSYNLTAKLHVDGIFRACIEFAVEVVDTTSMATMLGRLQHYSFEENNRLYGHAKPSNTPAPANIDFI